MPNGVAVRDGALYVAEVSRVLRFDNIEAALDKPAEARSSSTTRSRRTGTTAGSSSRFGPDGLALRARGRAVQRLRARRRALRLASCA
ncbi:MAG: hypothetical protein MZV64_28110 [Ignavibacteriales bacterium]|nr:hypothetical protein [Ignavibacteriales bacterium]